jgi:hypothetical protein
MYPAIGKVVSLDFYRKIIHVKAIPIQAWTGP